MDVAMHLRSYLRQAISKGTSIEFRAQISRGDFKKETDHEKGITLLKLFPPKCRLRIVRKPFLVFFVNRQLKEVSNCVNKHLYDSSILSEAHDRHSI